MKRILTLVLAFLIICCVPGQVSAESEYARVNDLAGLMSESETASLNELADMASEKHQFDITILTTEGTDGDTVQNYADLCYNDLGYGYGDKKDGILLLISMEERDWHISTTGYGETAFTLYGIDCIGNEIKDDLGDGNYYEAFKKYIDLSEKFLIQAKTGKPYDNNNEFMVPKTAGDYVADVIIGLIIGFVIALIIMLVMKSKLKSVSREYAAKNYVTPGSLNVTASRELYLYSTRTMTEKPKENNSSGSGSHIDSSGASHGGGGGKF